MNKLVIPFIVSFILSFLSILLLKKICLKFNICGKDKKPFIGGLCFSSAFAISYFIYNISNKVALSPQFIVLISFSYIVLFVEFLDDLKDFSLKSRLIIQLIFIAVFLLFGKTIQIYFLPPWLNYLLSFLWIMGITNAFNLLDIGDGICGGVSLIVCLSFLTVSTINQVSSISALFISILGAVLAFLLFNFPPSKVFMGNAGSHFLGFLFATLTMYGDYATRANPSAIILPLLILAFPIIDTFFLVISRVKKGISPFKKSDDHIFLRLISLGYSPRRALLIIYVVSILWALSGIQIYFGFSIYFLITVAFAVVFTVRIICKAGSAGQKEVSV